VGRRCAKQNAGWRSWCTFFASFLWASKEMKRKNILFFLQTNKISSEYLCCYHQQTSAEITEPHFALINYVVHLTFKTTKIIL